MARAALFLRLTTLFTVMAAVCIGAEPGPATVPAPAPTDTARSFYAVLLESMQRGPQLGFAGRVKRLTPEIRRDFDLPLMTRLIVGRPWRAIPPPNQTELIEAFSAFTVASFASEFSAFGGERFVINPATTPRPNGDVIVHTQLLPPGSEPVAFDYLMRLSGDRWQIIDVYLTGTISQLAARRSEYATVLREGGADALIKLLTDKTAALAK